MEAGRQGAEQLLDRGVTAIFAFNDLQAYGVLSYINECGLSVPNDVSLVGFDDIFYSSILKTKLTTVRQPVKELATETCKMTMKLIKGEACPKMIKLKTELIVRDSVADVR
jgi:LacI family transcriptional regulator